MAHYREAAPQDEPCPCCKACAPKPLTQEWWAQSQEDRWWQWAEMAYFSMTIVFKDRTCNYCRRLIRAFIPLSWMTGWCLVLLITTLFPVLQPARLVYLAVWMTTLYQVFKDDFR